MSSPSFGTLRPLPLCLLNHLPTCSLTPPHPYCSPLPDCLPSADQQTQISSIPERSFLNYHPLLQSANFPTSLLPTPCPPPLLEILVPPLPLMTTTLMDGVERQVCKSASPNVGGVTWGSEEPMCLPWGPAIPHRIGAVLG